jgi:hypothetical protein
MNNKAAATRHLEVSKYGNNLFSVLLSESWGVLATWVAAGGELSP